MPVYEYRCTACDHKFEELVSISGGRLIACPDCSSTETEKMLSRFQRTRAGGVDSPAIAAGMAAAPKRGGCCGGGCGCGH